MLFNKIKDEDFEIIKKIQSKTSYTGSEWSKLYLKSWDFFNYDNIEFAYQDDMAFIRFPLAFLDVKDFRDITYIYLPPMCEVSKAKEAIELARFQAHIDGHKFAMLGVPQEYVDLCKDMDLSITNRDGQNEYLYLTLDLIELKGKKYHSKRNHIAAFDKLYKYDFRPYTKEDRKEVEGLFFSWEETQGKDYDKEDEYFEYNAIKRSLDMAFEENIYAYVLIVDEKIIGFTLGEITPSNVGIIHIEKADVQYNGSYTKLMNMFAKTVLKDTKLINRQEDMGDEGLRQSKLSYKPIGYSMKYFLKDF